MDLDRAEGGGSFLYRVFTPLCISSLQNAAPSRRLFFFFFLFFSPDMFLFFNHNTAGNPDASYFGVIQLLDNVIRREINRLAPAKAERFWKTDYRPQICSPHLTKKRKKKKKLNQRFLLYYILGVETKQENRQEGKKESVEQK